MILEAHVERTIEEHDQLKERLHGLEQFLMGRVVAGISESEIERFKLQRWHMSQYLRILRDRIGVMLESTVSNLPRS